MVYRPILWRQSERFQDITSSQKIHITYSGNAKGRFTDEPKAEEETCQKSAQYTNLCKQIPEFSAGSVQVAGGGSSFYHVFPEIYIELN